MPQKSGTLSVALDKALTVIIFLLKHTKGGVVMTKTIGVLALLLAAVVFAAAQSFGAGTSALGDVRGDIPEMNLLYYGRIEVPEVLMQPGYMRPDIPAMDYSAEPEHPVTCSIERDLSDAFNIRERPDEPEIAFLSSGVYGYPEHVGSTCPGGVMPSEEVQRLDVPETWIY